MKHRPIFPILFSLALLLSCATEESGDSFAIRLQLDNASGELIRLQAVEDGALATLDSVLQADGTEAVIQGQVDGVRTVYLTSEAWEEPIQLLLENTSYEITGGADRPVIRTKGKAQTDLNDYNARLQGVADEMTRIRNQMRNSTEGDRTDMDSLRQAYYDLYDRHDKLDSAYIAENPASFATVLALRGTYYALDVPELEQALGRLDPQVHAMAEYQFMKEKLERLQSVAIGKKYTDFGLPTPEGDMLHVSDVHQGQVLMLDFWASWCGPCRRANPGVVEIYREYHSQGFEILGISLDRDSAQWLQAIADDQLEWKHISDLAYWNSKGAELYGVSSIPHTVLIDREGTIVARNLEGDDLREAIKGLL
ncbi:MAG: TlpA disulfide reductase family protein [Bacteroidales bacterium]